MEDLNWKYVGITAAVALVVCILYDRVLREYIPGGSEGDDE
jgi:hypothetical protein